MLWYCFKGESRSSACLTIPINSNVAWRCLWHQTVYWLFCILLTHTLFKHSFTCDVEETWQKAIPESAHLVPQTSVDLQTLGIEHNVFLLTEGEQWPALFAVTLPFMVHVGVTEEEGLKLRLALKRGTTVFPNTRICSLQHRKKPLIVGMVTHHSLSTLSHPVRAKLAQYFIMRRLSFSSSWV